MRLYLDKDIFEAGRIINVLHEGAGKWFRFVLILLGSISLAIIALLPLVFWPAPVVGCALIVTAASLVLLIAERYSHGVVNGNTTFTPDAVRILSPATGFADLFRRLTAHPRSQYLLAKLLIPVSNLADGGQTRDQIITAAKQLAAGRPVDVGDLLALALLESPPVLAALQQQHLTKSDLQEILSWERERESFGKKNIISFDPDYLVLTGGFAKDWAAGYTLLLDRYATDLTSLFGSKKTRLHIVGHQRIIDEIARNLTKSGKSNVLLVGDPGVGKKTAVLGFAQQVYLGQTLPQLSWKHVKMVDLAHLTAGADPETIEVRLITVLNEAARAGNVILFLDGIETILGTAADNRQRSTESRVSGVVDASAVLAKFLESENIQIIATTTYDAYHRRIEKNPVLSTQFEKVEVGEPTLAETELITLDASVGIENEYRILVSFAAVKEVVKLAERYLHDSPFPEKALDLLEEVAVFVARQTKDKVMLPSHVQEIVYRKTDIPVAEATVEERQVLMNLEERLHQRVVNQNEAIVAVSDALRRARAGLKARNKPIGTFLFLGPTGVGKTETARAVAEAYFGSENHMIRVDMNEYIAEGSAERLQEQLATWARDNPYTVVLFDEIEKANPRVMNLLLRVIDEGNMTDLSGRIIDLTNTIMIATSNAGAEQIREAIKGKTSFEGFYNELKATLLDYLQKKGIFTPEFLNRFDAVVLFQPLTPIQIGQVVELMINRLNRQLREQGVEVKLDPAAVEKLAQAGYDPVFGARALRRTIQEKVENVVAKKILAGQIRTGESLVLHSQDI